MKVAAICGAEKAGLAVAEILSKNHGIIVGSRGPAKTLEEAKEIEGALRGPVFTCCGDWMHESSGPQPGKQEQNWKLGDVVRLPERLKLA